MYLSAGCCQQCFPTEITDLIMNKDFLPPVDYLALARKLSYISDADRLRWERISPALEAHMPEDLQDTAFGNNLPHFLGAVCNPDGFNFHGKTHNSNGKVILEMLIKSSLGKCHRMSLMQPQILVCPTSNCYFRVHGSSHTRAQLHTGPTLNKYTGDVIVISFQIAQRDRVVDWMIADSPQMPKCIVISL